MNDIEFPDGSRLPYQADPDSAHSITPTRVVGKVVEELRGTMIANEKIKTDRSLSSIGRQARLEEVGDALIARLLKANAELDAMATGMDSIETQMCRPTPLDPGDAVGFLTDQERRAYVRDLPAEKRTNILTAIARGEHMDLTLALLRSPTPLGFEADLAQQAWQAKCYRENPSQAAQLAAGRRSLEWGRRYVGHLIGIGNRYAKADDARVARVRASLKAD